MQLFDVTLHQNSKLDSTPEYCKWQQTKVLCSVWLYLHFLGMAIVCVFIRYY